DVPLEQFGCFAELAPSVVRVAKMPSCDYLDGAIAEGARDGERLLPKFESCIVVASDPPLHHHEGGDPGEMVLIAKRPGEHVRLLEVIQHARPMAERELAHSESRCGCRWPARFSGGSRADDAAYQVPARDKEGPRDGRRVPWRGAPPGGDR